MATASHSAATKSNAPKIGTGLTESTHSSSSSSAERYDLDEDDIAPVLAYKYRGGLRTTSQKDLCALLDKDERLRVTKKPIPRYESYIDVRQHDLYLPEEHEMYKSFPSYDQSLASIRVPMKAYLGRIVFGNYNNLYIISPQSSPNSSVGDAESRRSTWERGSEEDAKHDA